MVKRATDNAVRQAVSKLGGVGAVARLLEVRERTVERWKRAGRVPDSAACFRLARASGMRVDILAGVEE